MIVENIVLSLYVLKLLPVAMQICPSHCAASWRCGVSQQATLMDMLFVVNRGRAYTYNTPRPRIIVISSHHMILWYLRAHSHTHLSRRRRD